MQLTAMETSETVTDAAAATASNAITSATLVDDDGVVTSSSSSPLSTTTTAPPPPQTSSSTPQICYSSSASSSTTRLKDDLKITASQKELMTSTVDSGVESLAAVGKRLQDSFGDDDQLEHPEDVDERLLQFRHPSNSSIPTSSPLPPSTGLEQVDKALFQHLVYCERLVENLGAFGPLKCREIYALEKLSR